MVWLVLGKQQFTPAGKRGHPFWTWRVWLDTGFCFWWAGCFSAAGAKMFDGLLWKRLQELNKFPYFLVEGEGKQLGGCIFPIFFIPPWWGKRIKVEASVPVR